MLWWTERNFKKCTRWNVHVTLQIAQGRLSFSNIRVAVKYSFVPLAILVQASIDHWMRRGLESGRGWGAGRVGGKKQLSTNILLSWLLVKFCSMKLPVAQKWKCMRDTTTMCLHKMFHYCIHYPDPGTDCFFQAILIQASTDLCEKQ